MGRTYASVHLLDPHEAPGPVRVYNAEWPLALPRSSDPFVRNFQRCTRTHLSLSGGGRGAVVGSIPMHRGFGVWVVVDLYSSGIRGLLDYKLCLPVGHSSAIFSSVFSCLTRIWSVFVFPYDFSRPAFRRAQRYH